MVCRAGGVPRPTITWVKGLSGDEKIVGVGEQFTIANTSGSDDGKYTCRAKNELGSDSREVTLNVQSMSEVVSQLGFCFSKIFYICKCSGICKCSENEINIRIPLCNVRHLNGMLNISLEIFPKKTHKLKKKKKIQNTVLCKKNANEFRRISAIVQPKNRRNFVISQSKFRRIFGELRENSSTSRKFADTRAKFRSDFVCTEAKFRIADRKFEILKRNFARLEGPKVTVFRIDNGSCLQARHHVSTRSHSTRSDLEK